MGTGSGLGLGSLSGTGTRALLRMAAGSSAGAEAEMGGALNISANARDLMSLPDSDQRHGESVITRSVWPTFSASSRHPSRYLFSTVATVLDQLSRVFAGSQGSDREGEDCPNVRRRQGCPVAHRTFFMGKSAELSRKFGVGLAIAFSTNGLCYENSLVEAVMGKSMYDNLRSKNRQSALSVSDMPRIIFSLMTMIVSREEHVCVQNVWVATYDGSPGFSSRLIIKRLVSPIDGSLFLYCFFVPEGGLDAVLQRKSAFSEELGSLVGSPNTGNPNAGNPNPGNPNTGKS